MTRSLRLDIGLDAIFAVRTWQSPDTWLRLTRELGYSWLEFCGDGLDPFFGGDPAYRSQTTAAIRAAAKKYEVKISSAHTGIVTSRFHGLSHSNEAVRARMREWIVAYMDLALEIGTDRIGGRWNVIPAELWPNSAYYAEAKKQVHQQFRDLARIAKEKGLAAIYNEQMFTPAEYPWTIETAYEFLTAVNQNNKDGVPVYLTVDTGHMAGTHYGARGEDLDYRAWLRHFGPVVENIHLGQTTPNTCSHWPFTEAYNIVGHIKVEEVLAAIHQGHEDWAANPLSQFMKPVERTILVLEVVPGATTREELLLTELQETASYLHRFVPQGGMVWEFDS